MASSSFALSVTLLETCRTDGGLLAASALEGEVEFFGEGFFGEAFGVDFAGTACTGGA